MSFLQVVGSILWVIVALGIVLGLAWLLLRWMNKRVPGMGGAGAAGRSIKVLDRLAVGRNQNVLLLRVETKVILVAVTEHAVEKLQEFDDPDGLIGPVQTEAGPSFSSVLTDAAGRLGLGKKSKGSAPEAPPQPPDDAGEGSGR